MRGEYRIGALAASQCGVVARRQLLAIGWDRNAVDRWLRTGRLHPVHRGVYLVGHPAPPVGAREMAAVLACGPGAVISHRSAAGIHELLPDPARSREVEVSVPRDCGRRPGIRAYRVSGFEAGERGVVGPIPVTSPFRTLLDLAAIEDRDLEQALAEAQRRHFVQPGELLRRAHGRHGAAALRRLIESPGGPAFTRSEAERRLLRLIRRAALPSPSTNARLHGYEVDFLWPAARLVVEVDGFAFHSSRAAFERDRARDAELAAAGYVVVRITWRRLTDRPEAVVARIAGVLASR